MNCHFDEQTRALLRDLADTAAALVAHLDARREFDALREWAADTGAAALALRAGDIDRPPR
jgi:hypothetical protein